MFLELANVKKGIGRTILDNADICIDTVMGKPVTGKQPSDMYVFWSVRHIWPALMSMRSKTLAIGSFYRHIWPALISMRSKVLAIDSFYRHIWPALMSMRSKTLPLTASCLSTLPGFESRLGHVGGSRFQIPIKGIDIHKR